MGCVLGQMTLSGPQFAPLRQGEGLYLVPCVSASINEMTHVFCTGPGTVTMLLIREAQRGSLGLYYQLTLHFLAVFILKW